ncbi:MAG TPA: cyclic nucleotide-binding domain-containing protein [Hyphomicrobiaceae bacterium]|nr:cyclic nucleotide-binding domain-containing protein [Hyphomicrobiaceae bacterium]
MRSDELAIIRDLALFADMGGENFSELMQLAYFQRFPPQVQLITEGDPADFLYVVTEGCVELFAGANERETTMALVRPVSTFILAAVLKDAVYLMSARTTQKSRVLMIPAENIRMMFAADQAFARSMVIELASCYRGVVKSLKNHKLRTATERLANYILRRHREAGGNGEFRLDVDKRTLASLLGMTPENLSRAFATLKSSGVRVDGRKIAFDDVSSLQVLAQPSILIDDVKI